VADKASARIALLDRAGEAGEIRALYDEIQKEVEAARDQLPLLQRDAKRLDGSLHELWTLQRKRAALQRLEQSELMSLQQEYEWHLSAEQKLEGLRLSLTERTTQFPTMLGKESLDLPPPPESERADALKEVVAAVETSVRANEAAQAESLANMGSETEKTVAVTVSAMQQLTKQFSSFRDNVYTPRVNALPETDRDVLTRQIQVLEETKRLPLVEAQSRDLLGKVQRAAKTIKGNCDAIVALRNKIVDKRQILIDALNTELAGVRLKFLRSANKEASNSFQQRYGQEGSDLVGYVGHFGKQESFENLSALFEKLANVAADQNHWDIDATLYDVKFIELLDVIDEDDIEIALDVGKAGLVPIQNLSAGQRSVAVFPLLLRNSKGPLVIDQPEDNLDNRYIADFISPDLLERKNRQQYLVTSHNANLVVLTDADLIVHVDSDGSRASFPASGFFACPGSSVKQSVLDVLDGGEAALEARQRKYGVADSIPF
jgi:hypothetical protein